MKKINIFLILVSIFMLSSYAFGCLAQFLQSTAWMLAVAGAICVQSALKTPNHFHSISFFFLLYRQIVVIDRRAIRLRSPLRLIVTGFFPFFFILFRFLSLSEGGGLSEPSPPSSSLPANPSQCLHPSFVP